jgi:hypothetical protein
MVLSPSPDLRSAIGALPASPGRAKKEKLPLVILVMIVKNEVEVIGRCLESVQKALGKHLAGWFVADTGSTDGTQDRVKDLMKDFPGIVAERPWQDFASNRNEALELARNLFPPLQSDSGGLPYALVMDADDVLVGTIGEDFHPLVPERYALTIRLGGLSYRRTQLFPLHGRDRYEGVVHEALVSPTAPVPLESLEIHGSREGSRSKDPDKYQKDARLLEAHVKKYPKDARAWFYLAQSWRDACAGVSFQAPEQGKSLPANFAGADSLRMLTQALTCYEHRATLPGWDEETWYALHEAAHLKHRLGMNLAEVTSAFLRAFERRPTRRESLVALARILRQKGHAASAYPFALAATRIPYPKEDKLFIEESSYSWRALDELAVSAFWCGQKDESVKACLRILDMVELPESEGPRVRENLRLARDGS